MTPALNTYQELVISIIKEQEHVIGPLAWSEANKVKGLKLTNKFPNLKDDGKVVIDDLVHQYSTLFGQASVEVCKDAVKRLKPAVHEDDLPDILK